MRGGAGQFAQGRQLLRLRQTLLEYGYLLFQSWFFPATHDLPSVDKVDPFLRRVCRGPMPRIRKAFSPCAGFAGLRRLND